MANKSLFSSQRTPVVPVADMLNAAGGKAYAYNPKHALAQIAATNCFNGTFYASAQDNLKIAQDAARALDGDPKFIAQTAVFARDRAYMKDMPAFLTVRLASLNTTLFRQVFRRVIDNGKMLRNFVQMARGVDGSGNCAATATGKVLNMTSYAIKAAIQEWFNSRDAYTIFKASIGNDPSMRDILRMCRPKPNTPEKAALFAYLKGAEYDKEARVYRTLRYKNHKDASDGTYVLYEHSYDDLPLIVRQYEEYKLAKDGPVPKVDFRMLDSLGIGPAEWKEIAKSAPWQMTRMNLNTFKRHGVFEDPAMVEMIAERLRDSEQVNRSRVFPYQLLMAYLATNGNMPTQISLALQDAMEIAVSNVPEISGQMYVCVDTSGSMGSAVTGYRTGSTSAARCVDVAALFACTMLRVNKLAKVIPFDTSTHKHDLNPRDSIVTNAAKLARYGGGGTDCSCPVAELNRNNAKGDLIVFVSDNESWVDNGRNSAYYGTGYGRGTGLMNEWLGFKKRNPQAKLVCIDLTPSPSSQVKQHPDILQVGGFSDQVFDVIRTFREGGSDADHWVKVIESVDLGAKSSAPVVEEVAEVELESSE